MGLVVLRRFSDLNQAQAAAAALRGAGLNPIVLEETTSSVLPLHQTFLGGCRVGVLEDEAELGAEILRSAAVPAEAQAFEDEEEGYEPPRSAPRWTGWWTLLGAVLMLTCMPAGCALVLARRKPTPLRIGVFAILLGFCLLFWGLLFFTPRAPIYASPY